MQKRLFGILASIAVIAAACGGATTSSAPPPASLAPGQTAAPVTPAPSVSDMADEQILRIDLGTEPPSLDPNKAQDSTSIAVLHALHRGLLYFDKDGKVVPALAEALPEVSSDAKTLTFKLRDATYSNGDPIVAGDIVYSMKRTVDPRTAAPYAYVMCEIVGADALLGSDLGCGDKPAAKDPAAIDAALAAFGVSAPDPKTVVVKLTKAATYFSSVIALWINVPVQQKWITSPNATEAVNYVGSGPFIMEKWSHNSQIILKPNPKYYGQKPLVTEIQMSMTKEPAQAQAAFENEELDMVQTPSEDVIRVKADPVLGPMVSEIPTTSITYYDYNNKTGPTANKNFRIALTQAIDKKAFINATFAGVGAPANSFVMPGIPGYQADLDPYPFDLVKAKESMAKALTELNVPNAAALGKLKFGFNSGAGHEPRVAFLAEAWRTAFGLETEQIGSEFGVFLQQRHAGVYALSRNGWGADYPHANNQLGLFVCGGGNNDTQFCNAEFDRLLNESASEPDQAKQIANYQKAQTIMYEDAANLPLRFGLTTYEIAPYLGGIQVGITDAQLPGDALYETMYIKKH